MRANDPRTVADAVGIRERTLDAQRDGLNAESSARYKRLRSSSGMYSKEAVSRLFEPPLLLIIPEVLPGLGVRDGCRFSTHRFDRDRCPTIAG